MKGGKREGAGRRPGSLSRKSRDIAERAAKEGITPLEVMLDIMRQAHASGAFEGALEAAKGAAPYMHPRLNAIEHKGDKEQPVEMVFRWSNKKD